MSLIRYPTAWLIRAPLPVLTVAFAVFILSALPDVLMTTVSAASVDEQGFLIESGMGIAQRVDVLAQADPQAVISAAASAGGGLFITFAELVLFARVFLVGGPSLPLVKWVKKSEKLYWAGGGLGSTGKLNCCVICVFGKRFERNAAAYIKGLLARWHSSTNAMIFSPARSGCSVTGFLTCSRSPSPARSRLPASQLCMLQSCCCRISSFCACPPHRSLFTPSPSCVGLWCDETGVTVLLAPGSRSACARADPGQAVVAVLGMAHVNGVAAILDTGSGGGTDDLGGGV